MNILPKKSWHVLSKKNVERVRRDEAEAKAIEEEKAHRAALAEQEAKVHLMRKRAREREGITEAREKHSVVKEGHVNFFADVEQGVGLQVDNVEHEAEKKAEQEKLEKRIGLLNYLVDTEKSDPEPWYMKKRGSSKEAAISKKREHRKELMDPLTDMKHYVAKKKKCLEMAEEGRSLPTRQEKHKDKHRVKHKKDGSNLEELRRERKRREEAERLRAEALMRRQHGGETAASDPVEDLPGRYNSQFNPHLVRQRPDRSWK